MIGHLAGAEPRVSVVMSVFNGGKYLKDAVQSVLNQSYPKFEFIVVDDASTDSTWEQLEAFAERDHRLRLLHNQENLGVAASLNRAIAHAAGELIGRQDADDISAAGRIEAQVSYLDAHPEVGLVGVSPWFMDDGGKQLPASLRRIPITNEEIQRQLLDWNCIWHGSVLMRRSIFELVGGYIPSLEPSEDYDLWLRFAEHSELANLDEALYKYRIHPSSSSSTRRFLQLAKKAESLEGALARRFHAETPGPLLALLGRDYLRAAFVGYVTGDVDGAQRCLARVTELDGSIFEGGPQVADVFERYIELQSVDTPVGQIRGIFRDLLPSNPHLRSVRRQLLSRAYMSAVFDDYDSAKGAVLGQVLHGVYYEPRWLLNRGVWSIAVRSAFRALHPRGTSSALAEEPCPESGP